jgi:hypothetical protein
VNRAAKEVVFARADLDQARSAPWSAAGRLAPDIDPQISVGLQAPAKVMGLDSGKLVRLIAELNDNHSRGNAYAAHALLRAVLDHVLLLLAFSDFRAAANNYPWGRTDRELRASASGFQAPSRRCSASADLEAGRPPGYRRPATESLGKYNFPGVR